MTEWKKSDEEGAAFEDGALGTSMLFPASTSTSIGAGLPRPGCKVGALKERKQN